MKPTRPPAKSESKAVEAFEAAIKAMGESDARLANLAKSFAKE